jgi:hypothetical protein
MSEEEWREAEAIVRRALAARSRGVRRQIGIFLQLLDVVSFVRHGRPIAGLPAAQRTRLLESLGRSRLLLMRRGIWGVRTLAFMGYYARPRAAEGIGYRASAAGWAARQSSVQG